MLSGKVAIPYHQPQAEHNEAYSRKIQITTNQKQADLVEVVDIRTRLAKLCEECQLFCCECYLHSHTRNTARKIANGHCACLHQTLMCTA